MTDGARDQVNYRIPSMLISVLGSSEVLNSALSLKSEFFHVPNVIVNSERIKFEMQKEK